MNERLSEVAGLTIYPSKANFLFVELPNRVKGRALRDLLLKRYGLMVRECSNKVGSSEQYLRLAVQRKNVVDVLVRALCAELAES
jgi:threonine-phosphate decarboxylase